MCHHFINFESVRSNRILFCMQPNIKTCWFDKKKNDSLFAIIERKIINLL